MSRYILITGLFVFLFGKMQAQTKPIVWENAELKNQIGIQSYPSKPVVEQKEIYTDKGSQSVYMYSTTEQQIKYALLLRFVEQKKDLKTAIKEEIQRMAILYGAYPIEQKIKDSIYGSITQLDIETSTHQKISAQIKTNGLAIVVQSIQFEDNKIKEEDVRSFFYGLKWMVSTDNKSEDKKNKHPKQDTLINQWHRFKMEKKGYAVYFPIEPELKTYFIKNDSGKDYIVECYSARDAQKELEYIFIYRQYDAPVKQHNHWIEKNAGEVATQKGWKIISKAEIVPNSIWEYLFSLKKEAYKVRYIYEDNSLYQFFIKGNKKSIQSKVASDFLEQKK